MGNFTQKLLPYFFILSTFSITSCNHDNVSNPDSESQPLKNEGLAIFFAKVDTASVLSNQYIDVNKVEITGKAFISYNDIVDYDTTNHIITLSYLRDSLKTKAGAVGVYGKPFVVLLDSQKIYGGWIWTPISSVPCHWVTIDIDNFEGTLSANELKIKLGYPTESYFHGTDPRNNRKIIARLIKDNKAK